MLYAVAHPTALVGLVVGFLAGVLVHGMAQAYAAKWLGDRAPVAFGRGKPDLRRHVDPFGAVAAAIGGVGWGSHAGAERWRMWRGRRLILVSIAGPLGNFALAAIGFLGFVAAGGDVRVLGELNLSNAVHGDYVFPAAQLTPLLFAMENSAMGFLSFIPLPPLEGSVLMFGYAPRTPGWQKAEYRLVEQNWGVGILLVLLVVPFSARGPLLIVLLDAIIRPLLGAVT